MTTEPPDPFAAARRLSDNRARVLAGEEIPVEEYKLLLDEMRQIRLAAAQAELRRPARKKATSAAFNPDDLMPTS